jgi:pyroglutamyl-peptidase
MRFLLTAFEPFDDSGLNSSLEGCRAFLQRWGQEFDVHFAVLPVRYGRDTEEVDRVLLEHPVDGVLHTGQATGRRHLSVERVAVNLRYGPSAYQEVRAGPAQQPILPGGPPELRSSLPVDAVVAALRSAGLPAEASDHAGVYLCNHVLYQSLLRAERDGSALQVGFLHVPCLPEQADGGMPAGDIARAIYAALDCLDAYRTAGTGQV